MPMKQTPLAIPVILLSLLAGCAHAEPSSPQPATAPATQPALTPPATPLAFEVYSGYFVSNQFQPDAAASFAVIRDQQTFDRIFGVARVMNDASRRLPPNAFDSKVVLTAIKRGKALWNYTVTDVTLSSATLTVRYSATPHPSDSAKFASPLIISIPKADFTQVVFEENGVPVRTAR